MNLFSMCCKIFFVRIIDVSLGTFVTLLTVKGKKVLATIIGFVDILIWFLIVKEAIKTDISSIWIAISYAGGYAVGTYVGTLLSEILIKGNVSIQVILNDLYINEIENIRQKGYAVSLIECHGMNNIKKSMLFIEVDKRKIKELKQIIKEIDKNAFFVINETKFVENGFFN